MQDVSELSEILADQWKPSHMRFFKDWKKTRNGNWKKKFIGTLSARFDKRYYYVKSDKIYISGAVKGSVKYHVIEKDWKGNVAEFIKKFNNLLQLNFPKKQVEDLHIILDFENKSYFENMKEIDRLIIADDASRNVAFLALKGFGWETWQILDRIIEKNLTAENIKILWQDGFKLMAADYLVIQLFNKEFRIKYIDLHYAIIYGDDHALGFPVKSVRTLPQLRFKLREHLYEWKDYYNEIFEQ